MLSLFSFSEPLPIVASSFVPCDGLASSQRELMSLSLNSCLANKSNLDSDFKNKNEPIQTLDKRLHDFSQMFTDKSAAP